MAYTCTELQKKKKHMSVCAQNRHTTSACVENAHSFTTGCKAALFSIQHKALVYEWMLDGKA